MAPERRVTVAAVGAVTAFDHLFRLPTLHPDFGTTFVQPLGNDAGEILFGGCGLNQAVALGRLGIGVAALGVVGDDLRTSGYLDHLGASGVEADGLTRVARRSGHSYILHADDGATLLVVEEGAATVDAPVPPVALPPDVRLVLLNMPFDRYACDIARAAVDRGADVLIAGQLGTAGPDHRAELSALASYVCCNEAEAASIGLLDPTAATRNFPRLRGHWVTRGAAGVEYVSADGARTVVQPPPARAVDPTGAGDGVVAGIAAGLTLGLDVPQATRLGAVVAAFVISRVGAQSAAPTRAEAAARYRQVYDTVPASLAETDPTPRSEQ